LFEVAVTRHAEHEREQQQAEPGRSVQQQPSDEPMTRDR
jgi:hypothetical protein